VRNQERPPCKIRSVNVSSSSGHESFTPLAWQEKRREEKTIKGRETMGMRRDLRTDRERQKRKEERTRVGSVWTDACLKRYCSLHSLSLFLFGTRKDKKRRKAPTKTPQRHANLPPPKEKFTEQAKEGGRKTGKERTRKKTAALHLLIHKKAKKGHTNVQSRSQKGTEGLAKE